MSKTPKARIDLNFPQNADQNRLLVERAAKQCLFALVLLAVVLIVTTLT